MKKLLDGNIPKPRGLIINSVAAMKLALNNLTADITEYIRWMKTDVTHVKADHWLVNYLILSMGKIGSVRDMTPEQSFYRTDFITPELARLFGFTTEYNTGRLHIGDNGAVTVYIIGKSPHRENISIATPYWEMIPMRYITHDSTSLSMGNHAEPEEWFGSGFDVIELDLSILHWQACAFARFWTGRTNDPRSLQHFVAMDVLPKLKYSQYDIAIMNRLTAMVGGYPVNGSFYRLSKSFPDRNREMSSALKQHLDFTQGRELSFEQAIASLPQTFDHNPFDTLSFNNYLGNRNINWALLIARYGLLNYLFSNCRVDPTRAHRWPVHEILRTVRRVDNDNGLAVALNLSSRKDFRDKLQLLLDMAG